MLTPNFSEVSQQFISLREQELRQSTIERSYKPAFHSFLKVLPDKSIGSYSPLDVLQFTKVRSSQVSATSVNIQLRALKVLGNWCSQVELLPERNAFSRLKLLKTQDKPVRFLSPEEFQSLLDAETSPILRDIYTTAVYSGIRLSQLLSLKWSDVNLEKETVTLPSSTSKNGRTTVLPLNPKVVELLKSLLPTHNTFIFQKPSSCIPTPYSSSYVSHSFLRTAKAAKIPNVSFHSLRKSFGSWLISSGVGIYHTSLLLTHQSVQTTQRFYLGASTSDLQKAVSAI